jgi:hypothetical protein
MKRFFFVLLTALFVAASGTAFAQEAAFSTALKDGASWIDQDVFTLAQKPWLHISVPETDFYQDWTMSFWNYPAPGASTFLSNNFSAYAEYEKVGDSDIYLSFNDDVWGALTKVGEWNISASTTLFTSSGSPYYWTTLKAYSWDVDFTVTNTPEPISSALFLLGAGALGLKTYRSRNKKK